MRIKVERDATSRERKLDQALVIERRYAKPLSDEPGSREEIDEGTVAVGYPHRKLKRSEIETEVCEEHLHCDGRRTRACP